MTVIVIRGMAGLDAEQIDELLSLQGTGGPLSTGTLTDSLRGVLLDSELAVTLELVLDDPRE